MKNTINYQHIGTARQYKFKGSARQYKFIGTAKQYKFIGTARQCKFISSNRFVSTEGSRGRLREGGVPRLFSTVKDFVKPAVPGSA